MTLATEARQFLRSTRHGILSTHSSKFAGYPFGSVTPFVLDSDCQPIILISSIAEHTKNIVVNPKVSLLIFAEGTDLQANARLTLIGEAAQIDKSDADLRARYLRYLPQTVSYFEMHDFAFYRITIHHARYIAGFGKMGWADGSEIAIANNTIAALENGMLQHMNADHMYSMMAYCQHFYNVKPQSVELIGVDIDGFDIRAIIDKGTTNTLRFNFETPISDAQSARAAFVAMSKISGKSKHV
ncbi:MAG: pyridoxamine 5'-phosphate oxidase [Proteobacteria bacterium ST_bin12]|nr:MAG: pyridoxamine 5'-phosphate oxidase [Proteobacteria bacterium ST_bin12]